MVATLDEVKRSAISTRLADVKALQSLMIANEQKLMTACATDKDIRERIEDMIEDDQENLTTINKAIEKLGMFSQPQPKTEEFVNKASEMMAGNELSLFEKALQHESMKHELVMMGLVIHKAAQVVGEDLQDAIDPLNKVNFKNRAHQEQLKSIVQVLGTRELTGRSPDNSIWAQAEDAIAALKGAFKGLTD